MTVLEKTFRRSALAGVLIFCFAVTSAGQGDIIALTPAARQMLIRRHLTVRHMLRR